MILRVLSDAAVACSDVYESTPHSGGYYHTTALYWPNGALKTLGGIPQTPTINYGAQGSGLDGQGRYTQITDSNGNQPMQSATYDGTVLGALSGITFGSGDGDTFTSDPNTGRFTGYTYTVGGQTDTGTLTWNTNGTLGSLAISDNIFGIDTQTCNYTYDPLSRITGANCSSQGSQGYTYDPFGNIYKTANGIGTSFSPASYNASNQPGVSGMAFDTNGNTTTDNLGNTYTWDHFGNVLSATGGGVTANPVYDALGRMVEDGVSGNDTEFVYAPAGQSPIATANGQAVTTAFVPLPASAQALYCGSGTPSYSHPDWLGSSRLISYTSGLALSETQYAPFGETYGNAGDPKPSFTGQEQDTTYENYQFPFRRLSESQGRWLSPDPAGLAAVDPTNPQSWNRYAYVLNNPLLYTDPTGMNHCDYWWGCGGFGDCANDPNCTSGDVPGGYGGMTIDGLMAFGFGPLGWGAEVPCPNNYCGLPGVEFTVNAINQWTGSLIYPNPNYDPNNPNLLYNTPFYMISAQDLADNGMSGILLFAQPMMTLPGAPSSGIPLLNQGFQKMIEKMAGKGTPMGGLPFKTVEKLIACVDQFTKDNAQKFKDITNGQQPSLDPVGNMSRCIDGVLHSMTNPF